jgi:prephenate dehydrogenase
MKHWDTVAIVGVGLIGGSIGLDLRAKKLARRVIGVGRRASSLKAAKAAGCVTETTLKLADAASQADLILVCTPVGRIVEDVRAAAEAARPNTLITDAGSTKASIVRALDGIFSHGITFVGSHPIAGSEKSGPKAAVRELYRGRVVVVTPTDKTPAAATRTIEGFWKSLGAKTLRMSPEAHDAALAATSHVPHVVASALAAATPADVLALAAGGWHDTTRIAASDGALWAQILCDNRDRVLDTLSEVDETLDIFREAIENRDAAGLERLWQVGKERRLAATRSGARDVKSRSASRRA